MRASRNIVGYELCEHLGGDMRVVRTEPYNPDTFVCTVEGGDPYDEEDVVFSFQEGGTDFECGPAEL